MILEVIMGVIMGLVLIALGIVTALILNNRKSVECMSNSKPSWDEILDMFKKANEKGGGDCVEAMAGLDVHLTKESWVKSNAKRIRDIMKSERMPPGDIWSDKERATNICKFEIWAGLRKPGKCP